MRLRSPYPEDREVPSLGAVVEGRAVVDVPADLVEGFLAAGWTKPAPPKKRPPKKPAVKPAAATPAEEE